MRFTAIVFLVAAAPALANNTGIFGKSGRDAEGGTCIQCHFGTADDPTGPVNSPPPTISVTGLDGDLVPGGVADLLITITRADATGGIPGAACPDRCAGVGAAVDTGAGIFVVPAGSPLQVNAKRDEISHIAKSPFVDGAFTYHVLLTNLAAGDHTLYVAGNDVDGQQFTGDRVGNVALPFTVKAPAPPPPADGGGCAQTSSTAGVFGFALVLLLLRRRSAAVLALALCFVSSARAEDKKNNNMDNCPSAVLGSTTAVKDVDGGVELTITGGDAKQIRDRSKALAAAGASNARVVKHDGKGDGGGKSGRCPVVMFKTSVKSADVDGGATLTVKADSPADVAWLREETRARLEDEAEATAGHGKMSHCPSALEGAVTKVTDTKDGVVVVVTGDAKAIRERTKALLEAAAKPDVSVGHGGNGQGGGGYGRCPVVVKDTTLKAVDVDGGSSITVSAKSPADVAALQKEAHKRATRFAVPDAATAAPTTPATPGAPTPAAPTTTPKTTK